MASPVNSTRAQEGRNLALREAAEGQVRGVLDGVHAVSGGDGGAHDGAQCSAGVGLGKAGVFVALVIEEARERIEPGRRHAEIAPQAIVGDGLRESGLARVGRLRRDLYCARRWRGRSLPTTCGQKAALQFLPGSLLEKVRRTARRRHSRFGELKAPPGFPCEASSAGLSRHWVCGRGTR